MSEQPGIGHNRPPADEADPFRQKLDQLVLDDRRRAQECIDGTKAAPEIIETAEEAQKVTTLYKLLVSKAKELDERRKQLKRPYVERNETIDLVFGSITTAVVARRDQLNTAIASWNRREREMAEARAAEERQRAQEMQRQAEGVERSGDDIRAEELRQQAQQAEKDARAETRDAGRTRTDVGTSGVKTTVVITVEDPWALATSPEGRQWIDEERLRKAVAIRSLKAYVNKKLKAGQPVPDIPGLLIETKDEATIR